METITIRQLHDETGRWVRAAAAAGGLCITERGKIVAQIIPAEALQSSPFFSRRKFNPSFLLIRRRLKGGKDSTAALSRERDER